MLHETRATIPCNQISWYCVSSVNCLPSSKVRLDGKLKGVNSLLYSTIFAITLWVITTDVALRVAVDLDKVSQRQNFSSSILWDYTVELKRLCESCDIAEGSGIFLESDFNFLAFVLPLSSCCRKRKLRHLQNGELFWVIICFSLSFFTFETTFS